MYIGRDINKHWPRSDIILTSCQERAREVPARVVHARNLERNPQTACGCMKYFKSMGWNEEITCTNNVYFSIII